MYCGTTHGIFLLGRQRVLCVCPDCISKPEADREFSCTQFEQHAGAGAAKKWKASLRVEPGSVPESAKGVFSPCLLLEPGYLMLQCTWYPSASFIA